MIRSPLSLADKGAVEKYDIDSFTTFHLQCIDFVSNIVCIICIVLTITLSVTIKIKTCLLGKL